MKKQNINSRGKNINLFLVEGNANDEINEILENGRKTDILIIAPPREGCEVSAIEVIISKGCICVE